MLKKFEVEGFRNFGKRFVLDLTKVRDYRFNEGAVSGGVVNCGIVYGRNAVGKTNFCNALFDVKANLPNSIPVPLRDESNYLTADGRTEVARFRYEFGIGGHDVVYSYTKRSRRALVAESLSIDGEAAFSYDHEGDALVGGDLALIGAENLNWDFTGASVSALSYVGNSSSGPKAKVVVDLCRFISWMEAIADSQAGSRDVVSNVVAHVVENDNERLLQGFLNRFGIGEELVVRETPSGERVLYFKKGRLVPFVENCSSGTAALLRVFHSCMGCDGDLPTFLFIDEFDAFYHHDLAEAVVGFFRERGEIQVLCASHNTDLFSNKVLRPDCLFVMSEGGIVSAADATRRELREGNNLEKLYKAGEFDAGA